MSDLQTFPLTNTWVKATWDDYLRQIEQPNYEKAKGYYLDGWMRIEMLPIGSEHAGDHTLIIFAVSLFATLKSIAAKGLDNCTYHKTGTQECQPPDWALRFWNKQFSRVGRPINPRWDVG